MMLENQSDRLREAGMYRVENLNDEAWNVLNKSLPLFMCPRSWDLSGHW